MTDETKAREWWIWKQNNNPSEMFNEAYWQESHIPEHKRGCISHVIEYAAFDAMKKERDACEGQNVRLREMAELETVKTLRAERDALQQRLSRLEGQYKKAVACLKRLASQLGQDAAQVKYEAIWCDPKNISSHLEQSIKCCEKWCTEIVELLNELEPENK